MADLKSIPSVEQPPSEPDYQPVSGYAVGAAVAAGIFAIILLTVAVTAVMSKRSAMWIELEFIPIVGFILAIIARSHIRKSEGTRTGLRLASASWWICVLGGAGFAAYLLANDFVLASESRKFAEKFFAEMQAGRVEHAFLSCVPPEERDRANPDAPDIFEITHARGGFLEFSKQPLVRLLVREGADCKFEHRGSKDVNQSGAGFSAAHVFRLTNPEGVFNVTVRMMANESKRSSKPQWFIPAGQNMGFKMDAIQVSDYGRLLIELEQEGDMFARTWMAHLGNDRPALAHAMTYSTEDRTIVEERIVALSTLVGGQGSRVDMTADFLPPGPRAKFAKTDRAALPFDELADRDPPFFRFNEALAPYPPDKFDKLRRMWGPHVVRPNQVPRQIHDTQSMASPPNVRFKDNVLTAVIASEFFENQLTFARAWTGVVSDNPELLAALAVVKAKDPAAEPDLTMSLAKMPPRKWRIGWLRTDLEPNPVITGPGSK